jgi:hypothetical protein
MRTRTYPSRRRRLAVLLVGALAAALVVTSGILIATDGARQREDMPNQRPTPVLAPSSPASTVASTERSDPRRFAVAAAELVFEWDTTTGTNTDGYFARVVMIADPDGVESDGLVSDLAAYFPSPEAWLELREYRTRQRLEVTSATVPSTWEATARKGEAFGLERGTTAYTITGIRHRTGTWNGDHVATRHQVTFTVFIICGPRYPTCYLVRLSRLDHPLP